MADKIDLCVRWNEEEGDYDVYERGGRRRLLYVAIDGLDVELMYEDCDPRQAMHVDVTVFGYGGTPEADEGIYAALKVMQPEKEGLMTGQDALRVADAATGCFFSRLFYVYAEAEVNEVFTLLFGFMAQDNEPSPEHIAAYEQAETQEAETQNG